MPLFRNIGNQPIEGVMPAQRDANGVLIAPPGEGFIIDGPMTRHFEALGMILVLDRAATAPAPAATPAALAALVVARDTITQQLALAKIENENLRRDMLPVSTLRDDNEKLKRALAERGRPPALGDVPGIDELEERLRAEVRPVITALETDLEAHKKEVASALEMLDSASKAMTEKDLEIERLRAAVATATEAGGAARAELAKAKAAADKKAAPKDSDK